MKHIIWDFNGTLLADVQLSVDADNAVFDALGLPRITPEIYRKHMTMPVRAFYEALGIDLNAYPYETISRIWLEYFNAGAVAAGLVPGAMEAIGHFERLGLGQSVLSASYEPSLRAQCDALALTPHMRAVDGLENEKAEKKTDIGLRQMARLGLAPGETVLVGDIVSDAELARALGVSCVLVDWGHNSRERLAGTGLPIAHTFGELAATIESMR